MCQINTDPMRHRSGYFEVVGKNQSILMWYYCVVQESDKNLSDEWLKCKRVPDYLMRDIAVAISRLWVDCEEVHRTFPS